MKSYQMMNRKYHDGKLIYKDATIFDADVPEYYLMRNVPDSFDEGILPETFSIICNYGGGRMSQYFFTELVQAFRVFRIMSAGREM